MGGVVDNGREEPEEALPEHPFYAAGKWWTATFELQSRDGVLRANGTWVRVEDVIDTGEWEPVYNLHVTDHHTYFVTE